MDTFVKGENEMWKMATKKRIQTRIVSASAVKRVLGLLSVCPPTHLKMFRHKETPINYYTAIILITEMWQNISGENLRLLHLKILSIFGSTQATFVNAHFLQCLVSSNTSVRVLQTAIYNHNFIVLLLLSSRISLNWFPTASGVLLLVSRIIYLNKRNRLDILIFSL